MAYIDPTNDPTPTGFEFGTGTSVMASGVAPAQVPPVAPLEVGQETLPALLDKYKSSPTSPVRQAQDDSVLGKTMNFMAGFSKDLPGNLKIRLAQQEAELKMSEHQLAKDNFYLSLQNAQRDVEKQNREGIESFYKLKPGMLAEFAAKRDDPEALAKLVEIHSKTAKSLHPEGESFIRFAAAHPDVVAANDFILSLPGSEHHRKLAEQMGYVPWMMSKERAEVAKIVNTDLFDTAFTHIPMDQKIEIHDGKHDQASFAQLLKTAVFQSTGKMEAVNSLMAHLGTERGIQQMIGRGVQTDKVAEHDAMSKKDTDPIKQLQAREAKDADTILQDAKKNPEKYNPAYLKGVQEKYDRLIHLKAPETSPGDNPNNRVNQRVEILSGGQYDSIEKAMAVTGPKAAQAHAWARQASKEQDQASGLGQMNAKMVTPGDTSNYVVAGDLRKGKLTPIRGMVAEGDLRDSARYIKVSPEQKKELRDIEATAGSADQIFAMAEKAYTGGSKYWTAAAEAALQLDPKSFLNTPLITKAKQEYPDLANYVSRREATLGKFARSVSGEVGVLTDQDTGRVRNLFPIAGDSKQIIAGKRKALQALISLNSKFAHQVLAGEMSPVEVDALKNSKEYMDAVNGILGSVEPTSQQKTTEKKHYGKSLLDEMKR